MRSCFFAATPAEKEQYAATYEPQAPITRPMLAVFGAVGLVVEGADGAPLASKEQQIRVTAVVQELASCQHECFAARGETQRDAEPTRPTANPDEASYPHPGRPPLPVARCRAEEDSGGGVPPGASAASPARWDWCYAGAAAMGGAAPGLSVIRSPGDHPLDRPRRRRSSCHRPTPETVLTGIDRLLTPRRANEPQRRPWSLSDSSPRL